MREWLQSNPRHVMKNFELKSMPHCGRRRRLICLSAVFWIFASCAAEVIAQQVWVRKGPIFYSNGRNEKPRDAEATDDSFSSTDINGKTNRITWSIPPATLVEGQEVVLTMESTTNEGAPLVGGWRVSDSGQREATVLDTDVGSFAGFKSRGVFNQARMVFKFKPGFKPTFSLKAGRYDAYGGHMSTLVTWTYEKGTAEPARSSDLMQFWEPKTTYSWCKDAYSSVEVKRAPANVSPEAGVVLVDGPNGKVLETYGIGAVPDLEGGTTLWVPDDGGWEVEVKVPGTAILQLEPSTTLRIPCRFASESERRRAEIEVSGGVLHYIWNVLTGQQHPDFVIIRTKDAIGGSKERPGNTGRNMWLEKADESRSAHHAVSHSNSHGIEDRDFTVDQRDGRGTRFIVYKGELEITPTNNQLRPFTLRAGQQVQISRSNVSAITPVVNGNGVGVTTRGNAPDANDPDLVPLKLYWSAERGDNYTTATPRGEGLAKAAGYEFSRIEGYVFRTQKPGTVPLKNYWSAERGDNFTTATAQGERAALAAGYVFSQVEGYIYPTQQPGTVPLENYWSVDRGDNFSTATEIGKYHARAASYTFAWIEGYIVPNVRNH